MGNSGLTTGSQNYSVTSPSQQPPQQSKKTDTEILIDRLSSLLIPLAQKDPRGWWIAFGMIGATAVIVLGMWFIQSQEFATHDDLQHAIGIHATHPHEDAVSRKEYQEVIRRLDSISKEQALQRQRTDRILERLTK